MRDWVRERLAGMADRGSDARSWPATGELSPVGEVLRSAAVLVPLVDRHDGMTVLLTQRTATLPKHAGQISFPGGQVAPGEITPETTALRETHEEIGVPASAVDLVGRLGVRDTNTGFRVAPVVGFLTPPFDIVEQASEVDSVFEVPLDFVCDPANHRIDRLRVRGEDRDFRAMPYGDYYIWGLTARILHELSEILGQE